MYGDQYWGIIWMLTGQSLILKIRNTFVPYSKVALLLTTVPNSRSECTYLTLFHNKMVKICTLFQTKTVQKPYPLRPQMPMWLLWGSTNPPPPPREFQALIRSWGTNERRIYSERGSFARGTFPDYPQWTFQARFISMSHIILFHIIVVSSESTAFLLLGLTEIRENQHHWKMLQQLSLISTHSFYYAKFWVLSFLPFGIHYLQVHIQPRSQDLSSALGPSALTSRE